MSDSDSSPTHKSAPVGRRKAKNGSSAPGPASRKILKPTSRKGTPRVRYQWEPLTTKVTEEELSKLWKRQSSTKRKDGTATVTFRCLQPDCEARVKKEVGGGGPEYFTNGKDHSNHADPEEEEEENEDGVEADVEEEEQEENTDKDKEDVPKNHKVQKSKDEEEGNDNDNDQEPERRDPGQDEEKENVKKTPKSKSISKKNQDVAPTPPNTPASSTNTKNGMVNMVKEYVNKKKKKVHYAIEEDNNEDGHSHDQPSSSVEGDKEASDEEHFSPVKVKKQKHKRKRISDGTEEENEIRNERKKKASKIPEIENDDDEEVDVEGDGVAAAC